LAARRVVELAVFFTPLFLDFAMKLALAFAFVCACTALSSGCWAEKKTRVALPSQTAPSDVSWRTMVRDRATLNIYSGRVVRFHLARSDCVVEGRTIRVWYGDRNVPPTLIVQCSEPVATDGHYTVTGLCGFPVADGIKRGLRIDYSVEVTDARVVVLP
jgi:hypothetical protein